MCFRGRALVLEMARDALLRGDRSVKLLELLVAGQALLVGQPLERHVAGVAVAFDLLVGMARGPGQ